MPDDDTDDSDEHDDEERLNPYCDRLPDAPRKA
jgi:hypothetical protein